jgi:hypothetical protein
VEKEEGEEFRSFKVNNRRHRRIVAAVTVVRVPPSGVARAINPKPVLLVRYYIDRRANAAARSVRDNRKIKKTKNYKNRTSRRRNQQENTPHAQ